MKDKFRKGKEPERRGGGAGGEVGVKGREYLLSNAPCVFMCTLHRCGPGTTGTWGG